MSKKWNHTVGNFLRCVFTKRNIFEIDPSSWGHQPFLPVYCWDIQGSIIGTHHGAVTHSPNEGHLGCFQLLAITKRASINIHVYVLLWTSSLQFTWEISQEKDFWVCSTLKGASQPSYHLPLYLLHILTRTWVHQYFSLVRSCNRYAMTSLCLRKGSWCWISFPMLASHPHLLLSVVSVPLSDPLLSWVVCFLTVGFGVFFIYSVQAVHWVCDLKILPPSL